MLQLKHIALTNFRSYSTLKWSPGDRVNVLVGKNGAGKTNLLEAISLLAPGKGLRGAKLDAIGCHHGDKRWGVAGHFLINEQEIEIGTGVIPDRRDRRVYLIDGTIVRSNAIENPPAILWLTPQMERLFLDGAISRRAFLDRLTYSIEPTHARRIIAHDHAINSRNKLLLLGRYDANWMASIEDQIAKHAVAITASRQALISRLNASLVQPAMAGFPNPELSLNCTISASLDTMPAVNAELSLKAELRASRQHDQMRGRSSLGAHRADVGLRDRTTGVPAAYASTGQLKSLLVSLTFAHASLIETSRGIPPIILLDEVAAHLDADKWTALAQKCLQSRSQIFITGTDFTPFEQLAHSAGCFIVSDGTINSGRFGGGKL